MSAWTRFRAWPRWAQWTVGGVVGLTAVGLATPSDEDSTPVRTVQETSTTAPPTTVVLTTVATTAPAPTVATTIPRPATTEPPVATTRLVSYANCTEVKAAGKAPIYRGQPGYSTSLDRDGDGIACDT